MRRIHPAWIAFAAVAVGAGSEYPTPHIREQRTVMVDGVAEIWRLQWKSPPRPWCEPAEESLACPCSGFAYGEAGDMDLIRLRQGREIDRLPLKPLFDDNEAGAPGVAIQKWLPAAGDAETDALALKAAKRPVARVMRLGDYDHNGQSTEFFLQTDTAPCGKRLGVVIGLSANNRKLHAFTAVNAPEKPMFMLGKNWEVLRAATRPVQVTEWACGDHASETLTTIELSWTARGLKADRSDAPCR